MLLAYLGPETMYPVASILAGVVGVFMMFGRTVVQMGRNIVRKVWPFSRAKPAPAKPPQAPVDAASPTP